MLLVCRFTSVEGRPPWLQDGLQRVRNQIYAQPFARVPGEASCLPWDAGGGLQSRVSAWLCVPVSNLRRNLWLFAAASSPVVQLTRAACRLQAVLLT